MKETISIRLDKDLAEKLDALCKRTDRNQSWHAREALQRYLADEQEPDTCNFDLERMKASVEGPFHVLPSGLTREQMRAHILKVAADSKAVMNIGNADSMAIARRGRDAIVAAHKEGDE